MLIGITGQIGAGKDTCADYLVEKHGFVKKSFADPLKRACAELFLFSDEQLYGTQAQKSEPDPRWFGATPRLVMQYVGTDLLRSQLSRIIPELGCDIFIKHFELWFLAMREKNHELRVVVPDVRFSNEFNLIKRLGGIVVKLERGEAVTSGHTSETELLKLNADAVFSNNGTLDDLYRKLDFTVYDSMHCKSETFKSSMIEEPGAKANYFLEADIINGKSINDNVDFKVPAFCIMSEHPYTGYIKLCTSATPYTNMRTCRQGNGRELKYILIYGCAECSTVEAWFKARLVECAVPAVGKWFVCDFEKLAVVIAAFAETDL